MFKERYLRKKDEMLGDISINVNNRATIREFLKQEEYKLKRMQGLSEVDERSYKTLYGYVGRLRNLNKWFGNKDWSKLTRPNIRKLVDDLEDGVITSSRGQKYADRSLYYQMLQGRLFDIVNRSNLAREVIRECGAKGRHSSDQVKFIEEESFRRIVDCAITPEQRCLLWLAFDIGENIGTLLALEKGDLKRQSNSDTNEPEFLVILSKEKLKRSRRARSEITNYPETVRFLDLVLDNLRPSDKKVSNRYVKNRNLSEIHSGDKLFKCGFKTAQRVLARAVEKSGVRCVPEGQKVTWKDLRSSMACDLLKKGWTRDEVNARLGHRPSSRIIDRYINYLALDRMRPKKKVYEGNLKRLEEELIRFKELSKLQSQRLDGQKQDLESLKAELDSLQAGKGFMKILSSLTEQQQQMAKVLGELTGKGFGFVLPRGRQL